MRLPVILQNNIIDFLTSLPNIHDSKSQRALIERAVLDPQLQNQIVFSGSSGQFFQLLIPALFSYGTLQDGRNALEAILETAKDYVGQEKKIYCETFIREVRDFITKLNRTGGDNIRIDLQEPHRINQAILFSLLRDIFNSIDEIRSFASQHFRINSQLVPERGLSVEIQSLISYCDQNGLLDNLVEIIRREYYDKYRNFREDLFIQHTRSEASLVINRGIVELRLRGNIDLRRPNVNDFLDDLKTSLINYFGLELNDILITEVRTGSIIVKGLFSEQALQKIKQANTETLSREFGIEMLNIMDSIFVKLDFRGTNLKGRNFSRNDLKRADLREVNLRGAILYQAILRLADLRRADLTGANLQGADLRGANLSEANLENASLVGAKLQEANIEKTNFIGADLRLTDLSLHDLERATYNKTTKLPTDNIT